jgi:hypothetical protein
MSRESFTIASKSVLRDVMMKVWQCVCAMAEDDTHGVEVTVSSISKRSAQANSLMWVRLGEVSDQAQWEGQKLTDEEWKDIFSSTLYKCRIFPNLERTGFVCVGLRTSKFSVEKMNNMITLIEAFGSERGVKFSADPNTYN